MADTLERIATFTEGSGVPGLKLKAKSMFSGLGNKVTS
jgi:hypothetical protein